MAKRRRKRGRYDGERRSMRLKVSAVEREAIRRYHAALQDLRTSRCPFLPPRPRALPDEDLRSATMPIISPAANYMTTRLLHKIANCPAMARIADGESVQERWSGEKDNWQPLWTATQGSPVGMSRRVYSGFNQSRIGIPGTRRSETKISLLSDHANPILQLRLNWEFIPMDAPAVRMWRSLRKLRHTFLNWKDDHLMRHVCGGYVRWEGAAKYGRGIFLHLHVIVEPNCVRKHLPSKLKKSWASQLPKRSIEEPYWDGPHDNIENALNYASGLKEGKSKILRPYYPGEDGLKEGELWLLIAMWCIPRRYRQIGFFGEWDFRTNEGKSRKRSILRSLTADRR